MLNEKEWKKLKEIKDRSSVANCAGDSGLSVEEARWLISLLERAEFDHEYLNPQGRRWSGPPIARTAQADHRGKIKQTGFFQLRGRRSRAG